MSRSAPRMVVVIPAHNAAEWYQRVIDLPANKFTAEAQKKLDELKSK